MPYPLCVSNRDIEYSLYIAVGLSLFHHKINKGIPECIAEYLL